MQVWDGLSIAQITADLMAEGVRMGSLRRELTGLALQRVLAQQSLVRLGAIRQKSYAGLLSENLAKPFE